MDERIQESNKVCLITGFGSPLAKKIHEILKERKMKIWTTSRQTPADFVGDLSNFNFSKNIVQQIGFMDLLICCHGGHKNDENNFVNMLNDNLLSSINICENVLSQMVEHKKGKIIVIGSYAACFGKPSGIAYSVAKSALHQYVRCIAAKYRDFGISVNCIAPGNISEGKTQDKITYNEIADVISNLINIEGNCINSQIIRVDRGKHSFGC